MFIHGKRTRIVINDAPFSCVSNSISTARSVELGDSTAFCDTGQRFTPGVVTDTVSLSGHWEDESDTTLHEALMVNDSLLVTIAPAGFGVGSLVRVCVNDPSAHNIDSSISDVTNFTLEAAVDDFIDRGVSLHDLVTETEDGSSAGVNNGTDTSNGGVAALHVTRASGVDPTLDVVIQHSEDGSTWVDLVELTQATDTTSERVFVSGDVHQHVRAIWEIGGTSPNLDFVVSFARR